jgi:uncharacterized protein (TIGR04255 family)
MRADSRCGGDYSTTFKGYMLGAYEMVTRPNEHLPEYDRPPVVEVAVSVQFDSPTLNALQIMLWYTQVRERFPGLEQTNPLPAMVESFGRPRATRPRVEFQLLDTLPTPRVFMINTAGSELLQIQQNRFGLSWRKLKPEHNYPRYRVIRTNFVEEYKAFQSFLVKEGLEEIAPNQCEITYVNHILGEGVWERHGELHKVIPSIAPRLSENFLPMPEDVQLLSKYVISGEEGKAIARLYVEVEPRYLTSGLEPIFLMRLTVRGAPLGPEIEGLLRTLDIGHEWIVRGFTTLTSADMHKVWRRSR